MNGLRPVGALGMMLLVLGATGPSLARELVVVGAGLPQPPCLVDETAAGNWAADRVREAFDAQVALIHSAAFRAYRTLPASTPIEERHLERFLSDRHAELRLVRIDGRALERLAEWSVRNGLESVRWPLVSGLAFVYDPASGNVSHLTLLTEEGKRPIRPEEELSAVVPQFFLEEEVWAELDEERPPRPIGWCELEDRETPDDVSLFSALAKTGLGVEVPRQTAIRICRARIGPECLAVIHLSSGLRVALIIGALLVVFPFQILARPGVPASRVPGPGDRPPRDRRLASIVRGVLRFAVGLVISLLVLLRRGERPRGRRS